MARKSTTSVEFEALRAHWERMIPLSKEAFPSFISQDADADGLEPTTQKVRIIVPSSVQHLPLPCPPSKGKFSRSQSFNDLAGNRVVANQNMPPVSHQNKIRRFGSISQMVKPLKATRPRNWFNFAKGSGNIEARHENIAVFPRPSRMPRSVTTSYLPLDSSIPELEKVQLQAQRGQHSPTNVHNNSTHSQDTLTDDGQRPTQVKHEWISEPYLPLRVMSSNRQKWNTQPNLLSGLYGSECTDAPCTGTPEKRTGPFSLPPSPKKLRIPGSSPSRHNPFSRLRRFPTKTEGSLSHSDLEKDGDGTDLSIHYSNTQLRNSPLKVGSFNHEPKSTNHSIRRFGKEGRSSHHLTSRLFGIAEESPPKESGSTSHHKLPPKQTKPLTGHHRLSYSKRASTNSLLMPSLRLGGSCRTNPKSDSPPDPLPRVRSFNRASDATSVGIRRGSASCSSFSTVQPDVIPALGRNEVVDSRPMGYWAGRFSSLRDIHFTEVMNACMQGKIDIGGKNSPFRTEICSDERVAQRVFGALQRQCLTVPAMKSLRGFQAQYAMDMKLPDLAWYTAPGILGELTGVGSSQRSSRSSASSRPFGSRPTSGVFSLGAPDPISFRRTGGLRRDSRRASAAVLMERLIGRLG